MSTYARWNKKQDTHEVTFSHLKRKRSSMRCNYKKSSNQNQYKLWVHMWVFPWDFNVMVDLLWGKKRRQEESKDEKTCRTVSTLLFSSWPIFLYLGDPRESKRTLCYTRVGLAHPLSLIADPSGPTGHTIPKKVNSVVMPSLWSDSQDSFDMCLSVKTSFLTLPLPTRPHFLSVIPSWHLLPLSLLLLSLLPYPPCALSPSIASSFPSLLSLPRSWLSRTHTVFLLSSPVFSL